MNTIRLSYLSVLSKKSSPAHLTVVDFVLDGSDALADPLVAQVLEKDVASDVKFHQRNEALLDVRLTLQLLDQGLGGLSGHLDFLRGVASNFVLDVGLVFAARRIDTLLDHVVALPLHASLIIEI